jgi:MFS family permease
MDKKLGEQAKCPMDKKLGEQAKCPMDKKLAGKQGVGMRTVSLLIAAFLILYALSAVFTGLIWDRGKVYRRDAQAGRFYLMVCLYLAIGLALIFLDELRAVFGP